MEDEAKTTNYISMRLGPRLKEQQRLQLLQPFLVSLTNDKSL